LEQSSTIRAEIGDAVSTLPCFASQPFTMPADPHGDAGHRHKRHHSSVKRHPIGFPSSGCKSILWLTPRREPMSTKKYNVGIIGYGWAATALIGSR
jgi:hypothetical protein